MLGDGYEALLMKHSVQSKEFGAWGEAILETVKKQGETLSWACKIKLGQRFPS